MKHEEPFFVQNRQNTLLTRNKFGCKTTRGCAKVSIFLKNAHTQHGKSPSAQIIVHSMVYDHNFVYRIEAEKTKK